MVRAGKSSMKENRLLTGFLFISPWAAGFCLTILYPLASVLYLSFCDYTVLTPALPIGLRNYSDILGDQAFWIALGNSVLFAALYLPASILLSLTFAALLNLQIPGKGILRTIYFLPTVVPMVCLAVIWQWLLKGDGGLVNGILGPLLGAFNQTCGTEIHLPNWLLEPGWARVSLIFASLWTTGNTILIYLAALQGVPAHLYESAELDGASSLQKYIHISIPSISPVIYYTLISGLIGCLQTFAIPYVLAGGGDGPKKSLLFLSSYIFQNAFQFWKMGYACALALILFALVLGLSLLLGRISARRVHTAE